MDIKPIETIYNGYRFRSRLEARWAVYFDALKVSYQYEPQGFKLDDGIYYLPDFYLPDIEAYVEIKPLLGEDCKPSVMHEAMGKMSTLALGTGKFGLFCVGDPFDNLIRLYGMRTTKNTLSFEWLNAEFIKGAELLDEDGFIYQEVFDVGVVVGDRYDKTKFSIHKPNGQKNKRVIPFNELYGFKKLPYDEQMVARQSRFEHGESGV